jgi:hypothetical protein
VADTGGFCGFGDLFAQSKYFSLATTANRISCSRRAPQGAAHFHPA